jgi:hypothetical protein
MINNNNKKKIIQFICGKTINYYGTIIYVFF